MRGKHFWANRPCASCRFPVHDKKNMVKGWKTISIGTFCRGVGVRNIINFPCSSPLWWLIRVSSSSWLQFLKMCENCNRLLKKYCFFHVHFTSMAFLWHDDYVGWLFGQCAGYYGQWWRSVGPGFFGGPKKVFSPLVTSTTESYTDVSFWLL